MLRKKYVSMIFVKAIRQQKFSIANFGEIHEN
jgi:hypothetical protein